ncbi:MAG: hypothetical protein R3251_03230 [Candidatus Spechtbacterales bacterium]|nr:hypothetical protein [Candidatus Spechtbacterales bacterium]
MDNVNILKKKNTSDGWVFDVEIDEGGGSIEYEVKLSEDYFEKLALDNEKPADLVLDSFSFLLAREPKEAILRSFNIKDINKYFPEFESEIRK